MAEKIILQHQAGSTKAAYERCIREYEQHRDGRPHSEAILLSFLAEHSSIKAPTTLWTAFSLIKKYLKLECNCDLGQASKIIEFLKTISRSYLKKKAQAFSREEIFRFLRETPSIGLDLVNKLVVLAGFYGGLRGCELVALTWKDLTFVQEGILLRIAQSKTDRAGVGVVKLLPKLEEDAICPLYYFTLYKELCSAEGRLFCQFRNGKFTKMPLGKSTIAKIPRIVATFLGIENPSAYTGHSLRVSSATALADEGATSLALKRHGRWASDNVAEGYIRESKAVRKETAGLLAGSSLTFAQNNEKNLSQNTTTNVFNNCVFNGSLLLQCEDKKKRAQ
jgi:integrase